MRVLTLVDALRLGGAETLLVQLARVATEVDLELQVLSLHGYSEERSKLAPALQDSGVEPGYLGVRRTLDIPSFGRLAAAIRRSGADVVHAHLEMAITLGVPAAALAGVPAVSTFHHVQRPLTGRAAARERLAVEVASRGSAVIFVSQASMDSFAARYRRNRAIPRPWQVVHNGVDLTHFAPRTGDKGLPDDLAGSGGPVVSIVAAFRDFKGIEYALWAWQEVHRRRPDARLLLVGSGEQEQHLRSVAARAALGDSVVFAGARSDVPEIMLGSDVVVLPSVHGENLPTVLIEAGGCARPVVASDVGGIRDIVDDGVTGLLAPPGDPEALAAAVLRLLADSDLCQTLGRAARERVVQLFDARSWALGLRSVYQAAIDGQRRKVVAA